jgi:hypothetical protein
VPGQCFDPVREGDQHSDIGLSAVALEAPEGLLEQQINGAGESAGSLDGVGQGIVIGGGQQQSDGVGHAGSGTVTDARTVAHVSLSGR